MNDKKLSKFLDLATQWLERELAVPTLEEVVEARVKKIYLERGVNQVFDKAPSEYPSVANLLNRKTSEVASKTVDAIEKIGDSEYKSQRQKELESAVAKALKEKEELEVEE